MQTPRQVDFFLSSLIPLKVGLKVSNFNAELCKFWQSRHHLLAAITLTCAMAGSDLETGKEANSRLWLVYFPASYDKDLPANHVL